MDDMTQTLEEMLLCNSLSCDDHDLIERCLEEGYTALSDEDKSTIRRMLNRRAARYGSTALQRWRERRAQREQPAKDSQPQAKSTRRQHSAER